MSQDVMTTRDNKSVFSAPPREEDQIKALLTKYGYTLEGKKMIAKQLGISLRTLYRKLDQYQLSGKN